jgi:hypothetical protein
MFVTAAAEVVAEAAVMLLPKKQRRKKRKKKKIWSVGVWICSVEKKLVAATIRFLEQRKKKILKLPNIHALL